MNFHVKLKKIKNSNKVSIFNCLLITLINIKIDEKERKI
jgi:hypothetical protein